MVLKNLTNGLAQTSMLVIGLIIKNMVSAFNIIPMEINIKADGKPIKDMAKEHIGLPIRKIN